MANQAERKPPDSFLGEETFYTRRFKILEQECFQVDLTQPRLLNDIHHF